MLTVKQIQADGAEEIFEVTSVRYEPEGLGNGATVWIEPVGGSRIGLPSGSVFVMNTAGKTVQRYDLSADKWQSKSAGPVVGYGELKAGTGTATSLPAA